MSSAGDALTHEVQDIDLFADDDVGGSASAVNPESLMQMPTLMPECLHCGDPACIHCYCAPVPRSPDEE